MKGAVKRNNSPPTGREDEKFLFAASPRSVETDLYPRLESCRQFIIESVVPGTEKPKVVRCRPEFYLSLEGLSLFQVVRGGI
jgi:hypothetical protein